MRWGRQAAAAAAAARALHVRDTPLPRWPPTARRLLRRLHRCPLADGRGAPVVVGPRQLRLLQARLPLVWLLLVRLLRA